MIKHSRLRKSRELVLIAALAFTSTGCIYSTTGNILSSYAVEHLVPHLMTGDDLSLACETGVSLNTLLLSFNRVTDEPHRAAAASWVAAATCAEQQAVEAELRQLRQLKANQVAAAQDARIVEKKAHALAAARYEKAYQHMVAVFGEPSEVCPALDNDTDELLWLLTMVGMINAVQHDRASGGLRGIEMDTPRKVARSIKCLNNSKWWGVPDAVAAGVWLVIPGSVPENVEPWTVLEEAATLGDKTGVRVARAIQAQVASALGETDRIKKSIQAYAKSSTETPAPDEWKMLDALAKSQAQALSDRLWTEATGHRTPIGQFGQFSEPAEETEEDDVLDDLDD